MNTSEMIDSTRYRTMFDVEDEHWWFHGMEQITAQLLDAVTGRGELPPRTACRVLDAGCGTGRNLRFLQRYGAAIAGIDFAMDALGPCGERGFGGRLARASVNSLPFADASFDLVTCFDVLVTQGVNDASALAEFFRVLRPGGWVFVRVAAYDWLRGRHDIAWRVAHRYLRGELKTKLRRAGFSVERTSYANAWLFPVAVAKRLTDGYFSTPASKAEDDLQHGAGSGLLGRLLAGVLASEAPLVARLPGGLPWGLSLVALARKPGSADGHASAHGAAQKEVDG